MFGAQNFCTRLNAHLGARLKEPLRSKINQQPVLLLSLSTMSGVLLDFYCWPGDLPTVGLMRTHIWWMAMAFCLLVLIRIRGKSFNRSIAAVLVFVPLGGLLHQHQITSHQRAGIWEYLSATDQPTIISGIVDQPPNLVYHNVAPGHRRSSWQTQMEVQLTKLRVGQSFTSANGRLLIVIEGRCDEFLPGDVIEAYGTLCQLKGPSNPGQQDFRIFYQYRNVQAKFRVADHSQITATHRQTNLRNTLQRLMAKIAAKGRDELLENTSDSAGPLAMAMLLGQRDYIDHATRDLLLVTGTAHLLSVSGMHLAILVMVANFLATFARLPLGFRITSILLFCLFYTLLTGGRPPVIRAAVLVTIFMTAVWLQRMNQPINTLSLAALILTLINPGNVLNVGVHLSFLAVLVFIICGRKVFYGTGDDQDVSMDSRLDDLIATGKSSARRYFEKILAKIGSLFWLSCSVTTICMPVVWYHFHVISLISTVVNLLLAPCLAVALVSGMLVVVTGSFHDSLAFIPGWICSKTMEVMQGVMWVAADIPWGHLWLPAPPALWVITFYAVLAISFFVPKKKWLRRIRRGWIVIWIPMAYLMAINGTDVTKDTLEATFLDVGHGTCVVIRLPSNEVWLYDCGRLGNETYSSAGIDQALWSMGITSIEGIILSHADADHFNALPGILKRFQVRGVITPPGMLEEPESSLLPIQKSIRDNGIQVGEIHCRMSSGDMAGLKHAGLSLPPCAEVLHPPLNRIPGSDNANSLVLHLDWGGRSMILPGDLEPPGTRMLVNLPRPKAGGILMAPHHGSLRMDAQSVLQWARPRVTIVSGGNRSRKPEVREMLSRHGSTVHGTAMVGAIRVQIGKQGKVRVQEWNCAGW